MRRFILPPQRITRYRGTNAKALAEHNIEDEVVLSGSFCIGKCNRVGVTVQVNDDIHVGVTKENFREFFKDNILDVINNERM